MLFSVVWRLNGPPYQPRESNSLSLGKKRFEAGKFNLAYRSTRRVLALNPNNGKALELKAALGLIGFPKTASPLKQPLLEYKVLDQAFSPSPYLDLAGAELLLSQGQSVRALALLQESTLKYPSIPHNWFNLGIAQRAVGDQSGAIQSLLKALELLPQKRYFAALGDTFFFNGDWLSALENYSRVIANEKWELSSRFGYLRSLLFLGQYRNAISFAKDLVTILTNSARIPQKENNKAKLIINDSKYDVLTDLSRIELIEYTEKLINISELLSNNNSISFDSLSIDSRIRWRPALQFDFARLPKQD
ncbi:MAG: tetratricopeptide repeat protein [bacterium]